MGFNFLDDAVREYGSTSRTTELHGIRGFRAWFESAFPDAVTRMPPAPYRTPSSSSAAVSRGVKDGSRGKHTKQRRSGSSSTESSGGGGKRRVHVEPFDHVLVDVNQLLHTSLRRARSEDHSLLLVVRELDRCLEQCRPIKSVVLAFDGPPSAAKLATQRRRRYGVLMRGEQYKKQLEYFARRGVVGPGHEDWDDYMENGGSIDGNSVGVASDKSRKKKGTTRLERYARDERTLCITPGTEYLERAESAFLYWAWQRLSNRRSRLSYTGDIDKDGKGSRSGVRVYISPSAVPGEGEVKLLDWLYQASAARVVLPSHSVAILGGDSDLVVQGLVVPPSVTHNVFVILPQDGKGRFSHCISLWETTRTLAAYLPKLRGEDIMRVRTDLVLLLIMNGNDYLPKLRGSSGFNKLFHTYLRLLKEWLDGGGDKVDISGEDSPTAVKDRNPEHSPHPHGTRRPRPFLVDPDCLEFNVPFCLAFFRRLAAQEPKLAPVDMMGEWRKYSITPLSGLNNLVDGGFLPRPIGWEVVPWDSGSGDGSDSTSSDDGSSDIEHSSAGHTDFEADSVEKEIVRLTLGDPPPNGSTGKHGNDSSMKGVGKFFSFETVHRARRPIQKTKQLLAAMALEDLVGKDYMSMYDYDLGNLVEDEEDDENGGDKHDNCQHAVNGSDDAEVDEDGEEGGGEVSNGEGMSVGPMSGYDWEVRTPAESSVERYLEGLIWNLQTYGDGICPNYAYNYGRRMSPGASELVEYLREAAESNKTLGPMQLYERATGECRAKGSSTTVHKVNDKKGDVNRGAHDMETFVPPLNAGLSCLAALPVQVRELVPEPYRWLAESGEVEEIYASCMNSESNEFSIEQFRSSCEDRIAEMTREGWDGLGAGDFPSTENKYEWGIVVKGGDRVRRQQPNHPPLRKIRTGSKFWTVLSKAREPLAHPFAPPEPFSDRLSKLFPSKWLRASRIMATDVPPPRPAFSISGTKTVHGSPTQRRIAQDRRKASASFGPVALSPPLDPFRFSSMSPILDDIHGPKKSIDRIQYKKAFHQARQEYERERKPRQSSSNTDLLDKDDEGESVLATQKKRKKRRNKADEYEAWLRKHSMIQPPVMPASNVHNQTSVTCLQQLQDGCFLSLQWELDMPSKTDYASASPEMHETVRLVITGFTGGKEPDNNIMRDESVYEQDRNINFASRKAMKQHLANVSLIDIVGKDWIDLSVKEMKGRLKEAEVGTRNR